VKKKPGFIMRALQKLGMPAFSYTALDNQRSYLEGAAEAIQEQVRGENEDAILPYCMQLLGDFTEAQGRFKNLRNAVFFLFGNTHGNFASAPTSPNPGVLDFLGKTVGNLPSKSSKFVITQNCDQNKESLMGLYNNPAAEKWMKNLLHRMVRDGDVTFDPPLDEECSKWEYFARWNEDAHCMEMGVRPLENHIVKQKVDGKMHTYRINKGTGLHMWNSFKYPHEVFTQILQSQGYHVEKVLFDKKDPLKRTAVYLCYRTPDKEPVTLPNAAPHNPLLEAFLKQLDEHLERLDRDDRAVKAGLMKLAA
jgi:uncharacterized SAM-dependent methyltransferase